MTPSTAPQTNPGTDTPSASYVLRRRYGRARHVILAATWITVINMLFSPVVAMAANLTWDANGATAGQTDGAGTWTAANQWWDGGANQTWNSSTPDNATIGLGGAGGTITIGTVTAGTVTFNGFSSTYTLSGGALTLNGAMTITSSAGSITISTPMGGAGSIAVNSSYAGTLTLSGANTYSGGTTLSAGTIIISTASSFPTVGPLIGSATGPLGKGTLTINGASTLRTDGTARTIANDFALNTSGPVTFGASSGANTLTISGQNQSITGTPTLSFNTVGTTFASYPMALNSSATLSNTGASGAPSFNGGLTVASGGSTITDSMSSTLTIVGPLTLNGNLTLTGTHAGLITMSGITETIVGSGGATLYFNDSAGGNGLTTYTTGPLILGGNFTLTGNSTKKPTVTINGLRVNNGVTSTFTLENNASNITLALGSAAGYEWIIGGTLGLTLTSPATAQTIGSPLVGAGSFTLNNGSTGVTLSGGGPLFSGTITIGNGVNTTTVLLGSGNGLPILANVSLAAGTTTLNIIGYGTQIGSLTGGTTATLTNTGGLNTLTVGNANNTTYSGVLTATTPANLALTKIGSGKLTLNGSVVNTYTGATKGYAGELALDLTNLGSPYRNLISSSSAWTLGGGTVSVKAHASSGAVAVQTLNGTAFAVGASAVSYDNNGAAGTSLALAALNRSAGSTVKFTLPASGNITTTTTTTQNGVLVQGTSPNGIAYATIGTTDWANYSGGNIVAIGGYDLNDFTANTKNTDVTGSQSPAAFTVNTLRFNSDGAALALNSSGASTVNTGGILITGNANSSGVTISGSGSASLKPGGGKELVVINYGKLALNAVLADNATSAVTYSGSGTTDLTGNSAGNTYTGVTTLNQGTLKVSANNQLGAVATGAAIYINGGTLQAGATFALDNSGAIPKRGVTVYPAGATFDTGANTLTISGIILSSLANAGLITKTGSGTLVLSGANTFTGGFNWSAGNLSLGSTLALGASSPNFVTFASAGGLLDNTTGSALAAGNGPVMFWNADFAMVGNASATATANDINMGVGAVLLGGNRTITVGQGSNYGTLTVGGVIHDGGKNYSLTKAGAGTLVLSVNSTYSGGTTLSAGTLAIGASSTGTLSADPSPGVVYGPVGTGTLTLNGGTLRSTAATSAGDRAIHNALAISGNVTLGDAANNGKLTFMGASQTIAAGSVVTALSPVTFGAGLTIGDGVKFYGPGLVTLQAQTVNSSSSNPIVIGDGTTFSGNGVGGNATVASQNSLGTAAVTIHYGGTLSTSAAFDTSNLITVKNGGTLSFGGNNTPSGMITLNSGATLASTVLTSTLTLAGNVSFPTAGVVSISLRGSTVSTANAYPAFDGTLVIGGRGYNQSGRGDLTTSGTTAVSSDRTLAFNHLNSGGLFLNGLVLTANLTVAGVGLDLPYGSVPQTPSTALTHLGNITGTSGNIIVAMSPLGLVSATGSAGWTDTTINSGTFEVSTSANNIGSGTVTLNGGALRLKGSSSSTKNITMGANGGVLEGGFTANPGSYSGTITGTSSAPLVIRSASLGGVNPSFDLSSATLTNFNGAVVLAAANFASPITLGANAVPSGGNTITVPKGIAFGGAAVKNGGGYPNNAKFITDPDSIYVVTASDTAPDLSNAGFARDIAVGLNGTALTGYTFPSAGLNQSTYRIVLVGTTTIAATRFTGGNNLDFSGAANVTDSNSGLYAMYGRVANGVYALTLTAAQDYSGSTTITGGIVTPFFNSPVGASPARLIVGTGGSLTQTSSIIIDKNGPGAINSGNGPAAYLELTGTAANPGRLTKANLPITIKGNGFLSIGGGEDVTRVDNNGVTDRIASTSDITLGGDSGGGNILLRYPLAGTHSQTLDALTIDAGMSTIQGGGPQPGYNAQTASGTANLIFTGGGSYTRNSAGMLDFITSANFFPSFTAAPSSGTAQGGAGDPILIGVTLNGADFVKAASGAVVAPTYSGNNTPSSWTDNNIQTTGAFIAGNINNTTVNSLRIAAGSSGTVTINNEQTLTLGSGMISSHVAWTMTGGSLTTSSGRDLILNTSANNITVTINSTITGDRSLLKSGKGTVTLGTSSGSNAIGDIYLFFNGQNNEAGTLTANLQGSLGQAGTPRTIYFQGGILSFANSVTQSYTDKSLNVGPSGGTWTDGGTGASSSFGGSVTMNGTLGITGKGVKTLTGSITGAGIIELATGAAILPGRLTLSGDNSGWTGGMNVRNGAQVRLDNANAAGTGPIVNCTWDESGAALIDFTSNFGTTLANDLVSQNRPYDIGGNIRYLGGFLISNAKTATPITLSGKLTTSGGLTFQGIDLGGGSVSETVLSGTVAVSGPQMYDYSFGGTTTVQNFINGPSGINLGVTKYAASQTTALAYGTAGFLAYGNAGTTTPVENGAEGYVRFDGAKSFIPGSVGPAYIAALRKGGAATLTYGYLLTAGSTYALPQGKSFLIGTLGSGASQTNGTFGASGTGTAYLDGGTKHDAATGQLLAGFNGGDVNIHGNAADSTAALNLLAKDAGTILTLGNGSPVVITPTWGDSGATTTYTLLRKRTGATTLNKTGAGTVEIKGANFTHTDGTDARGTTTLKLDAGTLYYNQNDASAANFAGVTLTGGTLKFKLDGASCTKINSAAAVALGSSVATLALEAGAPPSQSQYVLIQVAGTSGGVTGAFANSTVTVGSKKYQVVTNGGDGNDVALNQIVSGTLILLR